MTTCLPRSLAALIPLTRRLKCSDLASSSVLVAPEWIDTEHRSQPLHESREGLLCCVPMGVWGTGCGRHRPTWLKHQWWRVSKPGKKVQVEAREAGEESKGTPTEVAGLRTRLWLCRRNRLWRQLTFRAHGWENGGHFGWKVINMALLLIIF